MEAGKARLAGNTKRQASSSEVDTLRQENEQLKQLVAELALRNRVLKKKCTWLGQRVGRLMRYTPAEKMEIIRLVEASELPVKQTLTELDVPRSTFYRWYERYQRAGYDGLADQKAGPRQFWNRDSRCRA
jgi:transposase-like protein